MRKTFIAVAAIALLGYGATSASAGGSVVVNQTNHVSNVTQTFKDVDPCTGAPAWITIHFSGVQHLVIQSNGTGHFTETSVGTFSFDLLPADGAADATGRFVEWDGGNGLFDNHGNPIGRTEQTSTLNGGGTTSDGTAFHFHNSGHFMTDDLGNVTLAFFNSHCG